MTSRKLAQTSTEKAKTITGDLRRAQSAGLPVIIQIEGGNVYGPNGTYTVERITPSVVSLIDNKGVFGVTIPRKRIISVSVFAEKPPTRR